MLRHRLEDREASIVDLLRAAEECNPADVPGCVRIDGLADHRLRRTDGSAGLVGTADREAPVLKDVCFVADYCIDDVSSWSSAEELCRGSFLSNCEFALVGAAWQW